MVTEYIWARWEVLLDPQHRSLRLPPIRFGPSSPHGSSGGPSWLRSSFQRSGQALQHKAQGDSIPAKEGPPTSRIHLRGYLLRQVRAHTPSKQAW